MTASYDCVCRLCLSSRGELLAIFPASSSDGPRSPVLASKIKACVAVQISENDDLPTKVCRKCLDNVNNWYIFKKVCERTQNKLHNLMKKHSSLLDEVKIKNEPLSDEAYDDGVLIDGSYPDYEQNATSSSKLQPEGPPILASLGLTPRSDKKYVDPRLDWQRVHAILELVQEDEVIDSLQSAEECDVIQYSDHDSDTDAEMLPHIDDDFIDCKDGYLMKDRRLLSKTPKLSSSEITAKIKQTLKTKKCKQDAQKPCPQTKHAWQLIFSEDILEYIVESTNYSIVNNSGDTTNVNELKALIGILYFHGVTRPIYQKRSNLWDDKIGVNVVCNSMSLERFNFLLENIRFDKERQENVEYDIMKSMRKVFEMFALNCRTAHNIENVAVIDEVIIPVSGPCPFRYKIERKKIDSGMKIALLVDPSSFYVSNLELIVDSYYSSDEIVKSLVQHLAFTSRTIIMDSWYTSLSLVETLCNRYQLYSVGALNPKSDVIPPIFLSGHRPSGSFMTAFIDEDKALTSYVNRNSKVINVISSHPKHYKRSHSASTSISMYKQNQSAVEVLNVLTHYYTTLQYCNSWSLTLFFTLLDIASINAQVIWISQNTDKVLQRRLFIKELALSLMEEVTADEHGSRKMNASDATKKRMCNLLAGSYTRKRCHICARTAHRDRKTRTVCNKCGHFICRQHIALVCVICDRK